MNKLIGLTLIAAPFMGFGLMMGQETHMGLSGAVIAALVATGCIVIGTEVMDSDRLH